jgi:ER lumen protein retaining receptor
MNLFRLLGDVMHLISIYILIWKIRKTKSISGLSLRTQILYVIVFMTRYLDLFFYYISLYNTLMKLFFIGSSWYIVYLMTVTYRKGYDKKNDFTRIDFLLVPCAILSIFFNPTLKVLFKKRLIARCFLQILWGFSIFLEAVAVIPQLVMIQKMGEADIITSHYLVTLGAYRGFYLFNWLWQFIWEKKIDYVAVIAGLCQIALYADFFYLYVTRVVKKQKLVLPW